MKQLLRDLFGRKPQMTYVEELETAINYSTRRRFASLPDNEQSRGYYDLAAAVKQHADKLLLGKDAE
jgi:hypothetical protein